MKARILPNKQRIAWYYNRVGDVFEVQAYADELTNLDENVVQVVTGDWKNYLIESGDYELVT